MFDTVTCEKHLAIWMKAEESIANAQEYEHEGKKLKRADLGMVMNMQELWNKRLIRSKGMSSGFMTGVPR